MMPKQRIRRKVRAYFLSTGIFVQAGRKIICWGIIGAVLIHGVGTCRGQAVIADKTADSRFTAPTVKWLPKPQMDIPNADARTEADMRVYTETIPGNDVTFDMVPIRSGSFLMGSPESERGRHEDEGPRHKVFVEAFWMGKCEVTWDEYDLFVAFKDMHQRLLENKVSTPQDKLADALTSPSVMPYNDVTFGMGRDGYPAICMTQFAAKLYCRWLSAKTGRYYRLPTEAEWEYACRAGTKTAYSFGNTPEHLDQYAWHFDNSDERYHRVGTKKPNPWGLHDMHGNVSEWVLDQYVADFYDRSLQHNKTRNPFAVPTTLFPRVIRGGSWDNDPVDLRSAARHASSARLSEQDPQFPKSYMWHTDSYNVGFRIVRPFRLPSIDECDRLERIRQDLQLSCDRTQWELPAKGNRSRQ